MAILELTFEACVQDLEEFGSGPDRMVSRVYFWIRRSEESDGDFRRDLDAATGNRFARRRLDPPARYTGPMLQAEIVQPVGEDFQTGPIEVGPPGADAGPLDLRAFSRAATDYFRSVMSDSGCMQRREDGRPLRGSDRPTKHVRMRHNAELARREVRLPLRSDGEAAAARATRPR